MERRRDIEAETSGQRLADAEARGQRLGGLRLEDERNHFQSPNREVLCHEAGT